MPINEAIAVKQLGKKCGWVFMNYIEL